MKEVINSGPCCNEHTIKVDRWELLAAYKKWVAERRNDPDKFESNEDINNKSVEDIAEESVDTLLSYLKG